MAEWGDLVPQLETREEEIAAVCKNVKNIGIQFTPRIQPCRVFLCLELLLFKGGATPGNECDVFEIIRGYTGRLRFRRIEDDVSFAEDMHRLGENMLRANAEGELRNAIFGIRELRIRAFPEGMAPSISILL